MSEHGKRLDEIEWENQYSDDLQNELLSIARALLKERDALSTGEHLILVYGQTGKPTIKYHPDVYNVEPIEDPRPLIDMLSIGAPITRAIIDGLPQWMSHYMDKLNVD